MTSSEPLKRRLHPISAVVGTLRAIPQLAPVLVVAVFSANRSDDAFAALVTLAFLPLSILIGLARWWRHQYWVHRGELRVEEGLLFRRRTFIPRERIQALDVSAGVLQRMFGLVRLQIKTAAAGTQVELTALSRADAERLRHELAGGEDHAMRAPPTPSSTLHTMTLRQLLLAASTSGQLGVILSGVLWLYSQVDEVLYERLELFLASNPTIDLSSATTLVAATAVLLLITWVLSVVGAVLRFGGFGVERRDSDLVIKRGLLERREVAIPLDRVQAVRIVESLARQPFGYGTLYVESAGHAEEKGASTMLHPFLHRSGWDLLLREVLPELRVDLPLQPPPRRALPRFLIKPTLSALALGGLATLAVPYGWLGLFAVIAAVGFALLQHRDTGLAVSGQIAVARSRGTERQTVVLSKRCVQFAATARSFLQRRRRLATVEFGAASGAGGKHFTVRDLDEEVAEGFLAWVAPGAGAALSPQRDRTEG